MQPTTAGADGLRRKMLGGPDRRPEPAIIVLDHLEPEGRGPDNLTYPVDEFGVLTPLLGGVWRGSRVDRQFPVASPPGR